MQEERQQLVAGQIAIRSCLSGSSCHPHQHTKGQPGLFFHYVQRFIQGANFPERTTEVSE